LNVSVAGNTVRVVEPVPVVLTVKLTGMLRAVPLLVVRVTVPL
jgi:hypothetical protein